MRKTFVQWFKKKIRKKDPNNLTKVAKKKKEKKNQTIMYPINPTTTTTTTVLKLNRSIIPTPPPLKLPLLVLPNSSFASIPVCPFEVANTAGLTVAVPTVFVNTVVGND